MKRLITCLLVLVMVLSAVSCDPRTAKNSPEETFSTKDVAITLTTAFKQVYTKDYTACYEASDVTVYMIKESFEDLTEEQVALSVDQYAELVRANNINKNPGEINNPENGLVYFEYTYEDPSSGKIYKTFSSMYKSTNAFWTVQFCCEEEIYADYTELFTKWGLSVFFTLKDKEYEIGDFMITLSEGFVEKDLAEFNEDNMVVRSDPLFASYASNDGKVVINFKKKLKSETVNISNLSGYTSQIYEKYYNASALGSIKNFSQLKNEDGLRYFEFDYTQTIDNNAKVTYTYFTMTIESNKSYWTVEFACPKTEYGNYRSSIVAWASSMTTEKN